VNYLLIHRPSRRNVLLVLYNLSCPSFHHIPTIGFLPVLYTWFKLRSQQIQLQEEEPLVAKPARSVALEGWKVLLLWIPAACDLTATTVGLP